LQYRKIAVEPAPHAHAAVKPEHAVGDAVTSTLESYAAVLRRWALDNLDEIRKEWAATNKGAIIAAVAREGLAPVDPFEHVGPRLTRALELLP